jgi:hypothetical protein
MNKVEKNKTNLIKCKCKICPSYPIVCLAKAGPKMAKVFLVPDGPEKEAHIESLFCAYEPSVCIKDKKGCQCPDCSIHKDYGLDGIYYCSNDK